MKKTFIIFLLIILAVAAGGYFIYQYFVKSDAVDLYGLVPGNAVLVYETSSAVDTWNDLVEKGPWENLSGIPFYRDVAQQLEMIDTLAGRQGALEELLRGKPLLLSLHITGRDELDFIFYLQLESLNDLNTVRDLVKKLKKDKNLRAGSRSYQGYTIRELEDTSSGILFSYIFYKNYFLGSYTPFLVEDAIRNLNNQGNTSFFAINPGLSRADPSGRDTGNIYVNVRRMPRLLSVFSRETGNAEVLPGAAVWLDMRVEEDKILMNGFTLMGTSQEYWLQTFDGLKAQPLKMAHLIPDRTALLYHFTFDDARKWGQNLYTYRENHSFAQAQRWTALEEKYGVDLPVLLDPLGMEAGCAILAPDNGGKPRRLAIIHTKDIGKAVTGFTAFARNVSAATGDTLYHESYSGVEIRQLDIEEFPAILWGPFFQGFQQCFFIPVGDYLVFGNSIRGLKDQLNAISLEDTWGRSVKQSVFLDNILKEANMSVVVNTSRAYNMLLDRLSRKWHKFFTDHSFQFRQFEMMAWQFSEIENKYYTSVNIRYEKNTSRPADTGQYLAVQAVSRDAPLTTRPFVVTNHNTRQLEVFLQDSAGRVFLVGHEGDILWEDSLSAPIAGEVTQIDFFNNGNLQYFFATAHALHILDREGNYVSNYPLHLPDISIAYAAVIDYDNSKDYRFLVADREGNLYMFNKNRVNLEGWTPRKGGAPLSSAPFHLRVRGKDYIISVREDGRVNVMNRRGEMYPGFPVDLKSPLSGPLFVSPGTDFSSTLFTTITDNGLLVQFDLTGQIRAKDQLYRPTGNTVFRIVPDASGNTFVISRQNSLYTGILSPKGELLFEKDHLSGKGMPVQYYNLGPGRELYAITDTLQDFTYLYDAGGNLMNGRPLESAERVALLYYEDRQLFHIYSVYGNRFFIYSFAE